MSGEIVVVGENREVNARLNQAFGNRGQGLLSLREIREAIVYLRDPLYGIRCTFSAT